MPQAGEKAALDKDDQLIVNRSATVQRLNRINGSVTKSRGEENRGRGRVTRWTTTVTSALIRCCSY